MTRTASSPRARLNRMLAGVTAGVVALAASVLGAALPASATGTASVSGTVTSSIGGGPINGVTVSLYTDPSVDGFASFVTSTSTAADGTYTIADIAAGSYTLNFTAPDDDHLSLFLGGFANPNNGEVFSVADGEVLTGVDMVLTRSGSISGTVTDSVTGLPIEGVEVKSDYFSFEVGYSRTTVTAADGTYTLTGLTPADGWQVSFNGSALDYVIEYYDGATSEFGLTLVSVTSGQTTTGIDATLDQASSISGTVELAANPGVGYEGATIDVFDQSGNVVTTQSGPSGEYIIGGLAAGEYRVRASNVPGVLNEWWNNAFVENDAEVVTFTLPGETATGVDFSLDVGGSISGTVTGPTGDPLQDVVVEAYPEGFGDVLSSVTDASGAYLLDGVAPVPYVLSFQAPESVNARSQYYPGVDREADAETVTGQLGAAVTDISLQLPAGAIVAGRVVAEATGTPLPDIEVEVESDTFDVERWTTTDENGEWSIQGLPTSDDYTVRFIDYNDVYLREFYDDQIRRADATRVLLQAGSTTNLNDAALTEAATLSGRVVDEQGNGVPNAEVWLAPNGSLVDARETYTDENGDFQTANLRPGGYRVLVGQIFSSDQQLRSEWFENAYDVAQSTVVTLSAGEDRIGFDVELLAIDTPQYPAPPTISEEGGDEPGIQITLPTTGTPAYGAFTNINFGLFGDSFFHSPFDDGFWGYADEGAGYDGEALVMTRSFGADGFGPAVRQLIEVGAGPRYPVRPVVTATSADGSSVDVEWSIPTGGAGVDFWIWDIYSVGEPGEPYLQSGFADPTDRFSYEDVIGGLEPNTEYDLFVVGYNDEVGETYWGEARLTTTAGPAVQGLSSSPTPTITGGPRVGGTLTVATGTWGPAPVTLARQWLRDGVPIVGATAATYTPTIDDVGAEISVRVTGSKTGFLTQSRTSQPTNPVVDLAAATPSRLAGATRFETAAAISAQFPADVPVVYLATGRGFPDALSAASAAAALGGPLLITEQNSIPAVIADELVRLNPARVILAGGTGVVSTAVEQAVQALLPSADVDRHQGLDRYATSREIARNAFTPGETPVAYIATGRNFPDALAASAAAGGEGAPVILVNGGATTLDTATRTLLTDLQVEQIIIAGGTGVVSTGIENGLRSLVGSGNVTRLSGADRYLTAVAINDARFTAESTVYFATGRDFPDALAGAALAGRNGAPLYVVPGTCVSRSVLDSMARLGATEFVKFGGPGVLTSGVEQLTSC